MRRLKSILAAVRWTVSAGPFKGTVCRFTKGGDGVVAKLAGTYEIEIQPAFESAIGRSPELIVDVGAAEGFYVAGLARACPNAKVVAYEAKENWQERIRSITEANGVDDRCEIRGFCDAKEFRRMLEANFKQRVFILMDIEGGEFSLLTPEVMPLLVDTELLVELHESESRLQGDALVAMLGASHNIEVIWAKPERAISDPPSLGWRLAATLLPPVRRRLDEGRAYHMRWLHAVPKL